MKLRPMFHLQAAGHMYPNAWKHIEKFRLSKGSNSELDWPNWCFLPLAGFHTIVNKDYGSVNLPLHIAEDIARLGAIGIWRYTQGVYRFDDAIYNAVAKTTIKKDIPVDVLYRLPQWAVYIETLGQDDCYGFWAHLEYDVKSKRSELRLLLDTEESLFPIALHLGPWTVTEALDRMVSESFNQGGLNRTTFDSQQLSTTTEKMANSLHYYISLLLYLCSEEPDVQGIDGELPGCPKPKKVKGGFKLFPPKKPTVWHVGSKLAQQLKSYNEHQGGSHASPEAHIRGAHWQGYWTGKKGTNEQKFICRWKAPFVVNEKSE